MEVFLFSIRAKPTAGAVNAEGIAGALVTVFAAAESIVEAEIKARSFVIGYGWTIEGVEIAVQPNEAQVALTDAAMQELYRQARVFGVAGQFVGWPTAEGQPDDPPEVRLLGCPLDYGQKPQ